MPLHCLCLASLIKPRCAASRDLLYSAGAAKPQPAAPPAAKRGGPAPPPPMPAGGRGSLIKDAPKQAAAAGPPAGSMNALFSELNKVMGSCICCYSRLALFYEPVVSPASG